MNIELNGMIKFYYNGTEVIGKVIAIHTEINKITIKCSDRIYNLPREVIEKGEVKPVYKDDEPLKQAKVIRKRAEEKVKRVKTDVSLTGFDALKKDKQGEL